MKLNELEIKIAIGNEELFKQVFNMCSKLFGTPIHSLQLDEYYDTPDGQLKKQDLVIRIRTNHNKQTIALKSPRVNLPSGMTERIELEFLSADGEGVQEQLMKQGLKPRESAEKERWTFNYEDCEIVLDRLPFIGSFVEIEGPTESKIKQVVDLLQLSACQVISRNYGELMKLKFLELGFPHSDFCATFAKEKELKG